MKKIQLFLKYLVLMLFLIAWIIIMFFTDCMNSQSFKLYCMFVVGCGCAYSIWEKNYVPDAKSYIAEKEIPYANGPNDYLYLLSGSKWPTKNAGTAQTHK